MRALVVSLMLPLLVVVGCGGETMDNDQRADFTPNPIAKRLCERLSDECGLLVGTVEDCESSYGALQTPNACSDAIEILTCQELAASDGLPEACFPTCEGSDSQCAHGALTVCAEGRSMTISCEGMCASQGHRWTGVCGDSYQGQTTPGGQASCICE